MSRAEGGGLTAALSRIPHPFGPNLHFTALTQPWVLLFSGAEAANIGVASLAGEALGTFSV